MCLTLALSRHEMIAGGVVKVQSPEDPRSTIHIEFSNIKLSLLFTILSPPSSHNAQIPLAHLRLLLHNPSRTSPNLLFSPFRLTPNSPQCDPVYHQCCWNNRCIDNSGCETYLNTYCGICVKRHDGCRNQHRRGKDDCNKGTLNAQKCSDDLSNKCVSTSN